MIQQALFLEALTASLARLIVRLIRSGPAFRSLFRLFLPCGDEPTKCSPNWHSQIQRLYHKVIKNYVIRSTFAQRQNSQPCLHNCSRPKYQSGISQPLKKALRPTVFRVQLFSASTRAQRADQTLNLSNAADLTASDLRFWGDSRRMRSTFGPGLTTALQPLCSPLFTVPLLQDTNRTDALTRLVRYALDDYWRCSTRHTCCRAFRKKLTPG